MKATPPFPLESLGCNRTLDMKMTITLQNAGGHLAVHARGKKVLKKGFCFPGGLAPLLKFSCPWAVHTIVSFPLPASPINSLEKGSGLLLFVCIVAREPSSTC